MANVYLPDRERRQARFRRKFKFYLSLLAFGFLLIGVSYVVFVSSLFRVNEIVITGNKFIEESAVRNVLTASISGNLDNYIFWPNKLPQEFFTFLPAISEAEIKKDYLHKKITVALKERERFGIWCLSENERLRDCAWFDRNGVIFERAPAVQSSLILTVLGNKELPQNAAYIANISAAFEITRSLGISIKEVSLSKPEFREFYIKTHDGPELRFSLGIEPNQFSAGLEKLKNSPGFKKLRYIDMRVENKIYYK